MLFQNDLSAQRLALLAGGRDEITPFNGTGSSQRKRLKTRRVPASQVHALLGSAIAYKLF